MHEKQTVIDWMGLICFYSSN